MTFLEILSKLGILRWGVKKGVYHNAIERPIEFQDPGVFNAERDLVHPRRKDETPQPGRDVRPERAP